MYSELSIDSLVLESGLTIKNVTIGYHTYGKLNSEKNNVVWVCHALTANSDVLDWWQGLFGDYELFNPQEHFIICANVLGSCYGSTGPDSEFNNEPPLLDQFPEITIRDMVAAHEQLRQALEIDHINVLIGASLGGQQALEWSILLGDRVQHLVAIATNARHSAFGIAFNESQRQAIYTDDTFGGQLNGGKKGLAVARSIAMLSYRSYTGYVKTQTDGDNERIACFRASGYQRYQGKKLAERFSAHAYVTLSKAMDSHNVGRKRESIDVALTKITAKALIIGVSSDQLFPVCEQKFLATYIPNADYFEIDSEFGHDGFLVETQQLATVISDFLDRNYAHIRPTVFKKTIKKNQLMNLVPTKESTN